MSGFVNKRLISFQPEFLLDNDIEEVDLDFVNYKPEDLDVLSRETKFTKRELKLMYHGYKKV